MCISVCKQSTWPTVIKSSNVYRICRFTLNMIATVVGSYYFVIFFVDLISTRSITTEIVNN